MNWADKRLPKLKHPLSFCARHISKRLIHQQVWRQSNFASNIFSVHSAQLFNTVSSTYSKGWCWFEYRHWVLFFFFFSSSFFLGVNICQNVQLELWIDCTWVTTHPMCSLLYRLTILLYDLINRNTDNKNILCLEVPTPPNLVPDEWSCIFRSHYLKKERSYQIFDGIFGFYTNKYI